MAQATVDTMVTGRAQVVLASAAGAGKRVQRGCGECSWRASGKVASECLKLDKGSMGVCEGPEAHVAVAGT